MHRYGQVNPVATMASGLRLRRYRPTARWSAPPVHPASGGSGAPSNQNGAVMTAAEERRSGQTVLVVEDDDDSAALLTSNLQRLDYQAIRARSGEDALRMVHCTPV